MANIYSRSPSPESPGIRRDDDDEGPGNGSDNEDRRSNRSGSGAEDDGGNGTHSEAEEDNRTKAKNKKKDDKAAKKPKGPVQRQMISEDMLTGPKGMVELQSMFKDFEFRGKGKEKDDLGRILSKVEQWIHSLHPKHPFDQSLERIENLGMKKKSIKIRLKQIRMGMATTTADDEAPVEPMFDEEDDHLFEHLEQEQGGEIPSEFREATRTPVDSEDEDQPRPRSPLPQNEESDSGVPTFDELMEMEEPSASVPPQQDDTETDTDNTATANFADQTTRLIETQIETPRPRRNEDEGDDDGVPSLDEQQEMEQDFLMDDQ